MNQVQDNTILADAKLFIGLDPNEVDEEFDRVIISKINTSIARLAKLGLGTLGSFSVNTGNETWFDYLGEENLYILAFAKHFVELNTKLLFDPPQSGALSSAYEEQLKEAKDDIQTAIELHEIEARA